MTLTTPLGGNLAVGAGPSPGSSTSESNDTNVRRDGQLLLRSWLHHQGRKESGIEVFLDFRWGRKRGVKDGLLLFGDWTGPPAAAYIRAYAMSILRLVSTNFKPTEYL